MELVPILVMVTLVKKLVDTTKYAMNVDVNAVVTQFAAWGWGVAVAFIGANSDFGKTVNVNGTALGAYNGWSLVLVGVSLASSAGVGWDLIKAVDNSNSAVVPDLLPPVTRDVAPAPAP